MILLIPNNPFHEVKDKYIDEIMAAQKVGFKLATYSSYLLIQGCEKNDLDMIRKAFSQPAMGMPLLKPQATKQYCVSRGFTLSPAVYQIMSNLLLEEFNVELLENGDSYSINYNLPLYYAYLKEAMPMCKWLPFSELGISHLPVYRAMKHFGGKSVVIRDFHHSLKHFWDAAMFIKDSSNAAEVSLRISNFSEINSGFSGGLIIKEFVELKPLGKYPIGEIIASEEYRILFIDGKLKLACRYWQEFEYEIPDDLPIEYLENLAKSVPSRMFFMDLAVTKDGKYKIIELGTVQFSGFDRTRISEFYQVIGKYIEGLEKNM